MVDDVLSRKYRRLIVSELPDNQFIELKFRITPSPGYDLAGAAIRLLLMLGQRTVAQLNFEEARRQDIGTSGAVVLPAGPFGAGLVTVALPRHVVSRREGLTQIVLTATSAAEYGYTRELWLEDIRLPQSIINWFKGPRYGIDGIRQLLDVQERPFVGYVVKSRTGVALDRVLTSCRDALSGGVDFLVDDILSTDPDGELAFEYRVPAIARIVAEANAVRRARGSSRCGYIANIGASAWRAERYLYSANGFEIFGFMVDCFTMGFGNIHDLIDRIEAAAVDQPPVFVATNMGSGIMGRNPDDEETIAGSGGRKYLRTGFSEALTAKLSRLAGADAVHTGTAGSECFEVAEYAQTHRSLGTRGTGMHPAMPVAEGDLQLEHVAENVLEMGPDVIIETASGIANHPAGVKHGARAFRLLAGCLNDSLSRDDVDDILNLLMHHYPDEMRPVLSGWRNRHDARIRRGWSAEESIARLRATEPTSELQQLMRRRLRRRR